MFDCMDHFQINSTILNLCKITKLAQSGSGNIIPGSFANSKGLFLWAETARPGFDKQSIFQAPFI